MGKALERGLEENNLNQRPFLLPGKKSPKDDKDDGSVYSDVEVEDGKILFLLLSHFIFYFLFFYLFTYLFLIYLFIYLLIYLFIYLFIY